MQLDNYSAALKYIDLATEDNQNGAGYYERSKAQLSLDNHGESTSDLLIALTIDPTGKSYITFRNRLINNLNYASYEAKN
jgi:hypothetical protein